MPKKCYFLIKRVFTLQQSYYRNTGIKKKSTLHINMDNTKDTSPSALKQVCFKYVKKFSSTGNIDLNLT